MSGSGLGIPPPSLRSSSPLSQGDKENGKRKAGGVFMNEGKREKRDATKRKDKDMEGKILPSRAHEHVVREDKDESTERTKAGHPGGQK